MNRSPTSLLRPRLINSCSTPHSSGNSDRIVRAPKAANKSELCPIAGFAEIPENPSDPPHFNPRHNLDGGALTPFPLLLLPALETSGELRLSSSQTRSRSSVARR